MFCGDWFCKLLANGILVCWRVFKDIFEAIEAIPWPG